MRKVKFPPSFPYFVMAMVLLICGYPLGTNLTGMWEVGFFIGGIGVAFLVYAVFRQRFLDG